MSAQVPVLLVAGFLGAGKTTLLNHLLRDPVGSRIAVVVNDFGAINIDSMLVAGQIDTVALGNGCVCCAVDPTDLERVLHSLSALRPPVDCIVVEASGLAEPRALIRMVLAAESDRIRYAGLLYVVDAAEFDRTRDRHPELAAHVRLADLVVLNKADRVSPAELDALSARALEISGGAPIFVTDHGRVPPQLLFDLPNRAKPQGGEQLSLDQLLREHCCTESGHLHDAYQSVEFETDRPLHPRRLVDFLEDPPTGLFRTKGIVRLADSSSNGRRKHIVHSVGRHVTFEAARWRPGEARRSRLVLIGLGLDRADVTARLAGLEHTDDVLDPQAMLRVDALTY